MSTVNHFSYTAMYSIFDVKVCFSDCSQGSMRCKHVWIRMTRLAMLDDSSTDSFGRRSTLLVRVCHVLPNDVAASQAARNCHTPTDLHAAFCNTNCNVTLEVQWLGTGGVPLNASGHSKLQYHIRREIAALALRPNSEGAKSRRVQRVQRLLKAVTRHCGDTTAPQLPSASGNRRGVQVLARRRRL